MFCYHCQREFSIERYRQHKLQVLAALGLSTDDEAELEEDATAPEESDD